MKKGLKYTLICLGCLVVLAGVGLGIMYVTVSANRYHCSA